MIHSFLGLAQKGYDFADYVAHRSWMTLQFHANRLRHRLVLGGAPKRILVVRLSSIGDVVRASAVVRELRRRYPDAVIDFLTTETAAPVIRGNPALNAVWTLKDLRGLARYDWVVNLQNRDPAEGFLRGSGLSYRQVLEHLSVALQPRFVSGRHLRNGSDTTPTNILYCVAEMEELFLISLLRYDPSHYPKTEISVDANARDAARQKFRLSGGRPPLALFLGSNSIGCGSDEGFRTYSIDFLERLIEQFHDRFSIVVIGQSAVRNPLERQHYRDILSRHPDVVDLVDKTSLEELVSIMDEFVLVVSCDSSPIHIAMARGVPVVGLFVHDATFRLGPNLDDDRVVGLNSRPPCFKYSWRWKFFCLTCRADTTRAYYCRKRSFVFEVDQVPLSEIDRAANRLLPAGAASARSHIADKGRPTGARDPISEP